MKKIAKRTDDQLDEDIALACGWTVVYSGHRQEYRWRQKLGMNWSKAPNFSGCLNLMHQAEVYAIENLEGFDSFYWIKLAEITKCSRIDAKQVGFAEARDRAIAFVETIKILKL